MVSGRYDPTKDVVATRIVGSSIGERSATHVFGKSGDHLNNGHISSPQNGLPMPRILREWFRRGYISLEPIEKSADRWRVVEIAMRVQQSPFTNSHQNALHERELTFRNDFRPSKQYLYFAYCIRLLTYQRYQPPKWWSEYATKRNTSDQEALWATSGRFVRVNDEINHATSWVSRR